MAWTKYVLNFMEKFPEIPSKLYGKWWKVINDEFGEITEEEEHDPDAGGGEPPSLPPVAGRVDPPPFPQLGNHNRVQQVNNHMERKDKVIE